jgi:HPr kinase/phosphorylase
MMLSLKEQTIHGTALQIFDYGVIIIGNSGIGKSELSLRLIDRGHKFIADDYVLLVKDKDDILCLKPHDTQFMHLGGIGFIDIAKTFGNGLIAEDLVKCNLIIQLEPSQLEPSQRNSELSSHIYILRHKIPLAKLYMGQNRPLELLIEVLVKKQQQLERGYNANEIFINSLNQLKEV